MKWLMNVWCHVTSTGKDVVTQVQYKPVLGAELLVVLSGVSWAFASSG